MGDQDQGMEYRLPDGDEGVPTSQLADEFPQIDTPLRIQPPEYMKAPERVHPDSKDTLLRRLAFSPASYSNRFSQGSARGAISGKEGAHLAPAGQDQAVFRNAVADYSMLAFSSQRAGKLDMEGQSYLAIAISNDNVEQFQQAIDSYSKYLLVARKTGETVGEALARNCIGVDFLHLASKVSPDSPEFTRLVERARDEHLAHLNIADEGGAFVANTNLGLCFALLEDMDAATKHHQEALKVAIKLQSFSGQGIAVGNLGLLAVKQREYATAQACLEQHLQLVQSLDDHAAVVNAHVLLGELASLQNQFQQAVESYSNAAKLAESMQETAIVKRLFCLIGVAQGNISLKSFMDEKRALIRT